MSPLRENHESQQFLLWFLICCVILAIPTTNGTIYIRSPTATTKTTTTSPTPAAYNTSKSTVSSISTDSKQTLVPPLNPKSSADVSLIVTVAMEEGAKDKKCVKKKKNKNKNKDKVDVISLCSDASEGGVVGKAQQPVSVKKEGEKSCKPLGSGRLIVVGDVHGCVDQLKELLRTVGFDGLPNDDDNDNNNNNNSPSDTLILAGDLVNKGPASFEVVRFCAGLSNTYAILGNHDRKLLKLVRQIKKHGEIKKKKDRKSSLGELAYTCPDDVSSYLESLPHIIRIPEQELIVVHAGLLPDISLKKQDPWIVTEVRNMREEEEGKVDKILSDAAAVPDTESQVEEEETEEEDEAEEEEIEKEEGKGDAHTMTSMILNSKKDKESKKQAKKDKNAEADADEDGKTCPGSRFTAFKHKVDDSKAWASMWNGPETIIFGHDAKRRLQRHPYAVGIDTGCVYGGELTAAVFPPLADGNRSTEGMTLVQVPGYHKDE